jgi:hypothetical protein
MLCQDFLTRDGITGLEERDLFYDSYIFHIFRKI